VWRGLLRFCDDVVDGVVSSDSMMNAGAGLLLLKSERSLLDYLRAYLLASFELICWIAFETKHSIIVFYCCLDSWTVSCL
jgi:hypothetical protein